MRVRISIAAVLVMLGAAFAPALASAAPEWQRLSDPPGSDQFAPMASAPLVAYVSPAGIRVARANADGTWTQVGDPVRHASSTSTPFFDPSAAEGPGGKIWVTWTEGDATGTRQARVAKFDGTAWQEVVGGANPINPPTHQGDPPLHAYEPHLAFLEGTPYVGYLQSSLSDTSVRVVRLKADGSAWEAVNPQRRSDADPWIMTSAGRLYFTRRDRAHAEPNVLMSRLKADKSGWDEFPLQNPDQLAFGGRLVDRGDAPVTIVRELSTDDLFVYALGAGDVWSPIASAPFAAASSGATIGSSDLTALHGVVYVSWVEGDSPNRTVRAAFVHDGAWAALPSPSSAGADAVQTRLVSDGSHVYAMWSQEEAAGLVTHVARLGESAVVPPAGGAGGSSTGGGGTTGGGSAGGGNTGGGDTGGGGSPSGPPEPGVTTAGHCGHQVSGTPFPEVLRGTRGSDSIVARGGSDRLLGYAGNDCLFGGLGDDVLRGGSGADDLNGGPGKDLIYGGASRDEVGGGSGNDRIYVSGGGPDVVACGSGHDVVVVDRTDGTRGCERVIVRR